MVSKIADFETVRDINGKLFYVSYDYGREYQIWHTSMFTVLAACTITLLLDLNPDASRSVLGIILGGARLYPLTKKRTKLAVPLGANYHLIDIPVSNFLNSNISKINVLTQFNSASLNRHLSRAYASNMGGYKNEGFVEVLTAQQSPENPNWFQ
ncbi:unnamed protein product [Camellia sinensis]